jgi:hypothetical protein
MFCGFTEHTSGASQRPVISSSQVIRSHLPTPRRAERAAPDREFRAVQCMHRDRSQAHMRALSLPARLTVRRHS